MNKPLVSPELLLVSQLLSQFQEQPGGLLPLLHAVQDALGFIPASAVPLIAEGMNLSRAEVHGVITYYHYFRSTPPGQHVVQVCRAEACRSCGSEDLWAQAQSLLGCGAHETSADGQFSLEPAYCLGLCASSPAVQIDDKLHVRMNATKLKSVLAKLGSAA
jgi:formate dehydrogenase subunit gamma